VTAKLIIEIVTEASQAKKALNDTSSDVKNLGDKASIMGKALVAGAAAGAAGLLALGVSAFKAAEESNKIARETERVIKTIGAASWTSADQVADLAQAISDKTGADDEAIQSGANLLLTFANVKNEVGEGNDVFDQATGLALDMSTALGTDMSGAAVQLGKALNDPIKGITALSKAGVSFSADQKEQIRLMTESGDLLGAQKIVLAELSREFKGAAEAAGTPLDKLMVKFGNLQEAAGNLLIPAVNAAADAIGNNMGPAMEAAGGWISDHTELLKYLGSVALAGLAAAYGPVIAAQALLVGGNLIGWASSAIGYVSALGGIFLETAAAEGVLAAATGTLELTLLPLIAALAVAGGAIYAFMSIMDTSSESADKFFESVTKRVDLSNYYDIARSHEQVQGRIDSLKKSIDGQRNTWAGVAGAVADVLIPFGDISDSLNDQQDEYDTLNEKERARIDLVNQSINGLKDYAHTQALVAGQMNLTATASIDNIKAFQDIDTQATALTGTLLKIAESKKIELTSDEAVARVTALYEQTQFATTSTLNMSEAQTKFNDAAATAKDKTDAYKLSLDALVGTHVTAAQAETNFASNSISLLTTLTANRALAQGQTDASTASTLAQSKAIIDNDKAIQDNVKAALDLANAKYAETGSVDGATASLNTNRTALFNTMVQTGYTEEAANAYLDRLGLTPDNINTQVNLDDQQANKGLDTVNDKLVTAAGGANGKVTMDTRQAEEQLSGLERILRKIGDLGNTVINSFGDMFGRANGGPVAAGHPYLVGERGPELFMPSRGGVILTNAATRAALGGGSSPVINVQIINKGLGIDSPSVQRDVVNAIRRYSARNGPVTL